jgi:hypothetical protein
MRFATVARRVQEVCRPRSLSVLTSRSCTECPCPYLRCDVRTYPATDSATSGLIRLRATGEFLPIGSERGRRTALRPQGRRRGGGSADRRGPGGFHVGRVADNGRARYRWLVGGGGGARSLPLLGESGALRVRRTTRSLHGHRNCRNWTIRAGIVQTYLSTASEHAEAPATRRDNSRRRPRCCYCASHSRYFWGLRLHLVTTLQDFPSAGR